MKEDTELENRLLLELGNKTVIALVIVFCHCSGTKLQLSLVSLEVMNSFCSKLIMRFKIYAVTFVEFLSYSSINIYIFKFPTKMINLMLPHMH